MTNYDVVSARVRESVLKALDKVLPNPALELDKFEAVAIQITLAVGGESGEEVARKLTINADSITWRNLPKEVR